MNKSKKYSLNLINYIPSLQLQQYASFSLNCISATSATGPPAQKYTLRKSVLQ